jgi:hypothetical protein
VAAAWAQRAEPIVHFEGVAVTTAKGQAIISLVQSYDVRVRQEFRSSFSTESRLAIQGTEMAV